MDVPVQHAPQSGEPSPKTPDMMQTKNAGKKQLQAPLILAKPYGSCIRQPPVRHDLSETHASKYVMHDRGITFLFSVSPFPPVEHP